MRTIGNFTSEQAASRFRDFLYACGIESQFEAEDDGTFSFWVVEDAHLPEATALLARFRADPNALEFSSAGQAAAQKRRQVSQVESARRSTVADEARLGYERDFQGTPYFTWLLIIISVAVAVYSQLGEDRRAIRFLYIASFQIDGRDIMWLAGLPEVRAGQVWRLITPIFIHFSLLHIAFNMMLLKDLGTFIESRFSAGYMVVFVIITAALSNYGQYLIGGPSFGGMSGVDYALFGFLWMRGKFDRFANWQLNRNTVYAMVGWFFLCLTGLLGPIANGAHGIGLAAGMAWGWLSAGRRFSR